MKINKRNLQRLTLFLLILSSCSKKSNNVEPIRLEDRESIVLVPLTDTQGKSALVALDGLTGNAKWEIPFSSDFYSGYLENMDVASKILYINRPNTFKINSYADTTSLYTTPSIPPNLVSINASDGSITQQVYNSLKPDLLVGCCSTGQHNKLIKIENNIAYMVFATFDYNMDNGHTIYATDIETGSIKWKYKIPDSEKGNYAISSITLQNNKIFVGAQPNSFVLDAVEGKRIQEYQIGGLGTPINGIFYKLDNNQILAIDSKSGSVKWQFSRIEETSYTSLSVYNETVYFGTSRGKLYALNAQTGNKKWERQFGEPYQGGFHQLAAENGMLFASYMNGKMLAIDPVTGNTQWESQMYDPNYIFPWNFEIKGNFIYAWAFDGYVVALDKQTGLKKWEKTMGRSFYNKPRVFDDSQLNL